ncbi:MAG TPA: hypothetical protein VG944_17285 [Fimbriimonas sp.]|nr:hypothetical protein [Fimbriimonas sp.]
MGEEITVHKEAIQISGGRNLYIYTFDVDGKPMPEMRSEDIQASVPVNQENGDG